MSRALDRLEAAMAGIEACLDPGTGITVDDLLAADGPFDVDAFWDDFDEGLAREIRTRRPLGTTRHIRHRPDPWGGQPQDPT